MSALSTWKKELKAAGYKVSFRSNNLGIKATYLHIETGKKLLGNVFTAESLIIWKPLFDLIKSNAELIQEVREETEAFGLKGV